MYHVIALKIVVYTLWSAYAVFKCVNKVYIEVKKR